MHDAPQVDVDDPGPVLEALLPGRQPRADDAGVVAQHVHPAEAVEHGVAKAQHRIGIGDVDSDIQHVDVVRRANLLGGHSQRLDLDVGNDDMQ